MTDLNEKLKKAQEEAAKKDQSANNDEIEQIKSELFEMTELAKRAMADMQNLKRRQEEERGQIIIMANAELIKECLPVLDTVKKAAQHVPEGAEEWFKGLEMALTQLEQAFQNAGLSPIESAGQPFDPDLHEALAQGPGEKDFVIEEFEQGYKLGNRVLRHSKVKVGNGEKE